MEDKQARPVAIGQQFPVGLDSVEVGEFVTVREDLATKATRGLVFEVTKVATGANNVYLDPVAGGRGVRAEAWMLIRAERPANVVKQEPVDVGAVVTVSGRGWREPAGQFYVVTQVAIDGKCKLFVLGGTARGAHWNNIPRDLITVVDPARITITQEG